MNTVKRQTANGNSPIRACFGLVILMLISSLSPLIASSESPTWADDETNHGMGLVKFFPEQMIGCGASYWKLTGVRLHKNQSKSEQRPVK